MRRPKEKTKEIRYFMSRMLDSLLGGSGTSKEKKLNE
jgi:hypothetical protein